MELVWDGMLGPDIEKVNVQVSIALFFKKRSWYITIKENVFSIPAFR